MFARLPGTRDVIVTTFDNVPVVANTSVPMYPAFNAAAMFNAVAFELTPTAHWLFAWNIPVLNVNVAWFTPPEKAAVDTAAPLEDVTEYALQNVPDDTQLINTFVVVEVDATSPATGGNAFIADTKLTAVFDDAKPCATVLPTVKA